MPTERELCVRDRLLALRAELDGKNPDSHWEWMDIKPVSLKAGNKFLLLKMVDFRQRGSTPTRKVREFAEGELGDPDDLWGAIVAIPQEIWDARTGPASLHSTGVRHRKIRVMATRMREQYDGDARTLWADKSPERTLDRLEKLGLGRWTSMMTVGALYDEDELPRALDVKADVHVRRVFGRAVSGSEYAPDEVVAATERMLPDTKWSLDAPAWHVGHTYCHRTAPDCGSCPLFACCIYRESNSSIPP